MFVDANAAHVIMRNRRHLHRRLGQIDAIGQQSVDHRPESAAQLRRCNVAEVEIGAAVRRAPPGFDFFEYGVGSDVAGGVILAEVGAAVAVDELFESAVEKLPPNVATGPA
jgi:hypothetical protein